VENTIRRKNMKKMLAILLLVSAVVGMTIPAMAGAESQSDADNHADINVAQDASNYAAHTVAVSLDDATQSNGIGTNVAASGSNTNAALANFNADAKAKDAKSGDAVSGDSGSGATSGEAENNGDSTQAAGDNNGDDTTQVAAAVPISGAATSTSSTGPANSGNAVNAAGVLGNSNTADASRNSLTSGDVDNTVVQVNAIVQVVPVTINNDQTIRQRATVNNDQDAKANPLTVAIEQEFEDLTAGDDLNI
jgi:hypothetical protein